MEVEKRRWCGVWIELYQSMDESTAAAAWPVNWPLHLIGSKAIVDDVKASIGACMAQYYWP